MHLGCAGGFRRALTRAPLKRIGASKPKPGRHKGIYPANLHWQIFTALSNGDAIDVATYLALHTTIDLDGLYDLLEASECLQSWAHASYLNAREQAEQEAQR